MITQQAKDHAQACLDATKEAAIHNHMGDAQKAAYMAILARYEPKELNVLRQVPKPCPSLNEPHNRPDDCQCDNCARVGGYQPCSGYVAPPPPPKINVKLICLGIFSICGIPLAFELYARVFS